MGSSIMDDLKEALSRRAVEFVFEVVFSLSFNGLFALPFVCVNKGSAVIVGIMWFAVSLKVLMIIKGLFRRYERWNPVHPTSGAFWGMGVGIGCGIGWGPGFGPEVIGYVGAGCGVGFSVGITLLGIGIGLPANFLIKFPYDALVTTRSSTGEIVRSGSLQLVKNLPGDSWKNVSSCISGWQSETFGPFLGFKREDFMKNAVNLSDSMASNAKSIWENLRMRSSHIFNPRKGMIAIKLKFII
ncbi:hypothetical protein RJ641_000799 [Dillenia turbinata]|uniref:Cadmium-induced protein AS8 n=1 Tax=Dillenia turbinata TaxID=194707 RepID=A0AAN8ZRF2_9MAGN